eukprot:Selendium_serpulae@DN5876_c0_g1_i1.p1
MTLPDFLGSSVRLQTTYSDDVITGEVFSYDVGATNTLIIKGVCEKGLVNYNVVKISAIKEIVADTDTPDRKLRADDPTALDRQLPGCDFGVLERRECRAIDAFVKNQRNIGIGVSREAQEIFDFIAKTHPDCRWEKDTISVMGVTVPPPYTAENCSGETAASLERFRKVLDGFHSRREQKKSPGGGAGQQVPSNKAVLSGDGKAKEGEEPRTQSSGKLGETGSKRPFSGNGIAPFPKTATPRSQAAGSRTAPTGSANASRGRNKLQTGGESSVDAVSAESGRLIDSKQGPSAQAKDLRKGNKLKDTPVAEAKKAAATTSTGASRA